MTDTTPVPAAGDDPPPAVAEAAAIVGVSSTSVQQAHAQKTIVALELLPELEAEAKKREIAGKGPDGSGGRGNEKNPTARMPEGFGEAAEQAAEIVGVSAKSVYQAKVAAAPPAPSVPEAQPAQETPASVVADLRAAARVAARGDELTGDRMTYRGLEKRALDALNLARARPGIDCPSLDRDFQALRHTARRLPLLAAAEVYLAAETRYQRIARGEIPVQAAITETSGRTVVVQTIARDPTPPAVSARESSWRAPRLPPPPRAPTYQPITFPQVRPRNA